MQRIHGTGYVTAITAALAILPAWLAHMLRPTHFLCGIDPLYAGLHSFPEAEDGRSLRDTAHVAYGHHINAARAQAVTTVVLPLVEPPEVVLHELGHVLHERLGFAPAPEPVTAYAEVDEFEAFAEAFTMAHVPGYAPWDISLQRLATYRRRHPDLAPYFTPALGEEAIV